MNNTNSMTTTTPTNASPTNARPMWSDQVSGLWEFAKSKVKRGFVIATVGFVITVALFIGAGRLAWVHWIAPMFTTRTTTATTPRILSDAPPTDQPVVEQHNSYHAGAERDVCVGAPVGWRVKTGLDESNHPTYRICNK